MTTNVTTNNLGINLLGRTEYDSLQNKSTSELYVVKESNSDTDNSISSRTYADVGREAVYYGSTAPTSSNAKIWIDTSTSQTPIQPASIDIDNLSSTGKLNLQGLITPNFSSGTALSLSATNTYTMPSTGWIYITVSASSEIKLSLTNSSGVILTHIKTGTNVSSDKLFLKKSDKFYVLTLSGTVSITYYPCRSSV